MRGLFAGALVAVLLVACAQMQQSRPTAAPQANTSGALPPSPHQQIEDLDAQIQLDREHMGLPEPAPVQAGSAPTPTATPMTSSEDPVCHPGRTEQCTDTCSLADTICKNAAQICDLAKQLPGDTWAAGKCTSAGESCTAAHARCCGCQ